MMIIKLILAFVIIFLIPIEIGLFILSFMRLEEKRVTVKIAFGFVFGNIAMWAVTQLLAVPLILLKQQFNLLLVLWMIVVICLFVFSLRFSKHYILQRNRQTVFMKKKVDIYMMLLFLLMILLIGYQCYKYFFFMHLDEDDARFVVNALEAYQNNSMFLTNPATGEYMGTWEGELVKDVASPWVLYYVILAKLIFIHPTIIAHTILPVVLVLLMYSVYWLLGDIIFNGNVEKNCLFVIFVSLINVYCSSSTRMQSVYTMVRIWQGKAVVASIIVPLCIYLFLLMNRYSANSRIFYLLFLSDVAACFLSGMGIGLMGIMYGVYGCWFLLVNRKWKCFWKLIVVCMPTLIYGGIYVLIK